MRHSGVTGRGGGQEGQCAHPETFNWEIFTDLPGKERQGKKEKLRRKEVKWKKGRWKIGNERRKSYKMRRGPCFRENAIVTSKIVSFCVVKIIVS